MDSSELTVDELPASEEHERYLSIDEISIRKAIKDYEFDKLSREELELWAAENLLELKELRKSRIDLISKLMALNLRGKKKGKRKGWIESLRNLDKTAGGENKSASDLKSIAIRGIVAKWEALKESNVQLARGAKQSFLDDELKSNLSLELDRKNIENQLKY
jgi:hypothetical protein